MKCSACGDEIPFEYMLSPKYVTGYCVTCEPEVDEE